MNPNSAFLGYFLQIQLMSRGPNRGCGGRWIRWVGNWNALRVEANKASKQRSKALMFASE
jgi:hypothetical protein